MFEGTKALSERMNKIGAELNSAAREKDDVQKEHTRLLKEILMTQYITCGLLYFLVPETEDNKDFLTKAKDVIGDKMIELEKGL